MAIAVHGFQALIPRDVRFDPSYAGGTCWMTPASGLAQGRVGNHDVRPNHTPNSTTLFIEECNTNMPLKINIAMSRKVGAPHYGSRGATVGLEIEADASLVAQPRELQERVAGLFRLAKEAVDWQLDGPLPSGRQPADGDARPAIRPATPAQIRAIHALASRGQLDLVAELEGRFDVDRPADLTVEQASQLIDAIQQSFPGMARSC